MKIDSNSGRVVFEKVFIIVNFRGMPEKCHSIQTVLICQRTKPKVKGVSRSQMKEGLDHLLVKMKRLKNSKINMPRFGISPGSLIGKNKMDQQFLPKDEKS